MTSLEIDAFLTVYREGSITKAAESLYINQSSLSTRLRTLERELGCCLFDRNKGSRKLLLTPAGQRFLPLAQQYQELEAQMQAVCHPALTDGVLRVSSLNSIGSYLLPPAYAYFSSHWPEIRLEIMDITTAEAKKAITRDELDIAFSTLSGSTDQITTIPFLSEPMAFLCSAKSDYPDPVSLANLSPAHEVYSFWSQDLQQWHKSAFGANAEPQVRLELMSQIRLFTAMPQAWAIVPQSIANALQNDPELQVCKTTFPIPDRMLYILCRRAARNTKPIVSFLDSLKTVLQEKNTTGLLL